MSTIFALLLNPYAEGNRFRIKQISEKEPEDWHLFLGKDEKLYGEYESYELAEQIGIDFLKKFDSENK